MVELEPDNADAIYQLGIAHEQCDEQDMAMMIYQKLIENTPTYINAYIRKSTLLMKMELYNSALDLYKQILKINPNYAKGYYDIAFCLDKLGKQREAKRYYHKFLEYNPDDKNANFAMRRMEKLKKISNSSIKLSLV